mmetsp:Transcript_12242/g.21826  ORF Transcript_12242/g.21826 Transcript_12242/m.21826 type:complete len:225 (-) Transcript_12242:731-1405(-)
MTYRCSNRASSRSNPVPPVPRFGMRSPSAIHMAALYCGEPCTFSASPLSGSNCWIISVNRTDEGMLDGTSLGIKLGNVVGSWVISVIRVSCRPLAYFRVMGTATAMMTTTSTATAPQKYLVYFFFSSFSISASDLMMPTSSPSMAMVSATKAWIPPDSSTWTSPSWLISAMISVSASKQYAISFSSLLLLPLPIIPSCSSSITSSESLSLYLSFSTNSTPPSSS